MRRTNLALSLLSAAIVFVSPAAGEPADGEPEKTPQPLAFHLTPSVDFPILESSTYFTIGGTVALSGEYTLPSLPFLVLRGELDYTLAPSRADQLVHMVAAGLGAGLQLSPLPWLTLKLYGCGGWYHAFLGDAAQGLLQADDPFLTAGAGVSLNLGPGWTLGVGAFFRSYLMLSNALGGSLDLSYAPVFGKPPVPQEETPPEKPKPLIIQPTAAQPATEEAKGLEIVSMEWESVFPVFRKYYDNHAIGRMVVTNAGTAPVSNIAGTLFIRQYMDAPKEYNVKGELAPGESRTLELFALLTDKVLEVTEATKSAVEIALEYRMGGTRSRVTQTDTLRVHDRNAMTWVDNARAAAFVTAKDPQVLYFSNNTTGMVKGGGALNRNLRLAIAIHEALHLYGMNYRSDPRTPYVEFSQSNQEVDFLQFPRQSLEYRAGDCDDLAILYCALLESVGVETAFVTIPGHIFVAFSLDMSSDEAKKGFHRAEDLILWEGRGWIPIEVTSLSEGFLQAWQMGAKQWREHLVREQVGFHAIHTAWKLYEPVGLVGSGPSIALPSGESVSAAYQEEVRKLIEREINPKVAELQGQIEKTRGSPAAVNALGVLYARYELWDSAIRAFEKVLEGEEYAPALVNLGNVLYAKGDMRKALPLYERAYRKEPSNPRVMLALARVNHELENYGVVKSLYADLKKTDPSLAQRYTYLDLRGEEAVRAADVSGMKGVLEWVE